MFMPMRPIILEFPNMDDIDWSIRPASGISAPGHLEIWTRALQPLFDLGICRTQCILSIGTLYYTIMMFLKNSFSRVTYHN